MASSGVKRHPSDAPERRKARLKKMKELGVTKRGSLEFYYKEDTEKASLKEKLDTIKKALGDGNVNKTTTLECLHRVFDYYIESNNLQCKEDPGLQNSEQPVPTTPQYILASKDTCMSEAIFLTTPSAMDNLVERISAHNGSCPYRLSGSDNHMHLKHSMQLTYTCSQGHTITWVSSPHINGGKHLVNMRMAHAYFSSGMLPIQYEKFCEAANIGVIGEKSLAALQKEYKDVVQNLAIQSTNEALQEEMAATVLLQDKQSIDVIMDARHCWRANARFTDVVCIGDITHKVLRVETVSKQEEPCSQRHELLGVKKIYNYLDNVACPVDIHCHDSSSSVGKYL